jgi:hypothetical protein
MRGDKAMQSEIHAEIYQAMSLKSEEELLEIWQKNDHVGWRDEVFDVIAEILQERQVELPLQNEAILNEEQRENLEMSEDMPDEEEGDETQENQPAFYDPAEADRLDKWLKWLSYAIVVVTILSNLSLFPSFQYLFSQLLGSTLLTTILGIVVPLIIIAGNCALMYFAVYALKMILRILREMEVKSRASAAD